MELDVQGSSAELLEALNSIRSQVNTAPPNKKALEVLIKSNAVAKLVSILSRPNSKIVDVSLSILATLLLQETPRNQIRHCKGIRVVLGIIGSIGEESILSRACRALANMGMTPKNVDVMFEEGVLPLLLKTLSDVSSPRTKQVIVRAIRILGSSGSKFKRKIVLGQGIVPVSDLLDSQDKELLRAVTRCLAHFTHGGDLTTATQVQSDSGRGFRRLAELARSKDPKIAESSLSCLINLSHIENVRPNLGNAGTISVLVDKIPESKSDTEVSQGILALCLFCRESVNRMKIRDSGGLGFLVEVLSRKPNLTDKILQSLLQFHYDSLSLNTLQDKGLIPSLLRFLNDDKSLIYTHSCEAEISLSSDGREGVDHQSSSLMENEMDTSEAKVPNEPAEVTKEDNDSEPESNEYPTHYQEEEGVPPPETSPSSIGVDESSNLSNKRSNIKFRVDSPSYQEVQKEFQRFLKVRDSVFDVDDSGPNSICQSPDRSPWSSPSSRGGYSPDSSCSGYSPRNDDPSYESSSSPSPKYSSFISDIEGDDSNQGTPPTISSPQESKVYSPIENFSETEEEEEDPVPSTSACSLPPPPKKRRISKPANVPKVQSIFDIPTSTVKPFPTEDASFSFPPISDSSKSSSNRTHLIFQILSRLSQAERPHENMVALDTTLTLLRHLFTMSDPGESRVARILLRLSRNLYVFMSYVYQRQIPYLRAAFDSFCTLKDSPCNHCTKIKAFLNAFTTNVSLLAETGYAEGEMCHNLIKGNDSEKRSIAISTPFVSRPRKLLRNILINHEGLEIIFEVLEGDSSNDFFSHSVMSLNVLASHLGVINPNLAMEKKVGSVKSVCKFKYDDSKRPAFFVLDDGSEVIADREFLSSRSQVFEAMLVGAFMERGQEKIKLPLTSKRALECLIHRLYGCKWRCGKFKDMSVQILLELLIVSDKYLLEDFSIDVSREIIRRCYHGGSDIIEIYKGALLVDYPVRGLGIDSLAKSTIQYILVGTLSNDKRVQIFKTILASELKNDFIEDMSKIITSKLCEI